MKRRADYPKRRIRPLWWAAIAGGILLFVGANAHLIYVAFDSQPECVPHVKENTGETGKFTAANSAC